MAFFDGLKERVSNAAASVGNIARGNAGEAGRISEEKRNINAEIAHLYSEIGRIYYESDGGDAAKLHPLCERISALQEKLEALDIRKMQIDKGERCPSCGAAMPVNAKYCSNCGKPMPDAAMEEAPDMSDIEYCPECGAMRSSNEAYCPICSAPLPEPDRKIAGL